MISTIVLCIALVIRIEFENTVVRISFETEVNNQLTENTMQNQTSSYLCKVLYNRYVFILPFFLLPVNTIYFLRSLTIASRAVAISFLILLQSLEYPF